MQQPMAIKESKICLIDDNEADREVIRRYLLQDTDYIYQIFEEDTGEKGVALCRSTQPDCVLLDYNLPDMDGLEVLTELADDTGSLPFAVVMLTGLGDEAVALQAMKRGAQDYLVKGEMTAGNLFRSIHNAIEREAMRRTLERQQRDLELKNQEIEAFAYALAHDLRAPLRAISSFAQIVAHDYAAVLDNDGQHYVEHIVHSSGQMDRLINELLSYTRIEHRAVRKNPVALERIVAQGVESLAERIALLQANVSIADGLPIVLSDATLLTHIFVNLLDNALTYHHPHSVPMVQVSSVNDQRYCVLAIRDNGIGIAQKHSQKIFQIFQRLHSDEEYPGTGIGLAIVKKAMDLLDGKIWFESVVNQGSTFYVQLPLYL